MRKLEAMRLEVDSRRRTVGSLDKQLTMQKMKTMKRQQVHCRVRGLQDRDASCMTTLTRPSALVPPQSISTGGNHTNLDDIKMAELIKDTDRKKQHKEEKMQGGSSD